MYQFRQRSLSICLEVLNSSTYHANFVQPPPQQLAANAVWLCYSTLSSVILHACRSRLSSVSHLFSSLTTQPPFWRNKRTKLKRDASPLIEKIPRLPMNIIHQNLHRRHHQQRARIQVNRPSPILSSPCSCPSFHLSTAHLPSFHHLVHVPASIWCLVQNRSHGCQHARPRCVRTFKRPRDRVRNLHVHGFVALCDVYSLLFQ